MAAVEQREQAAHADYHIEQRNHNCFKLGNPQVLLFRPQIRLRKRFDLRPLPHKCLDHAHARKALLHKVRQLRHRLLTLLKTLLHQFSAVQLPKRDKNHWNHCHQRQFKIDIEHHLPNDHSRHNHRIKRRNNRGPSRDEHRIQIACKARHQIARLMLIIVLHVQRFQMTKHLITQLMLDRARRAKEKIAPKKTPHRKRQANAKYDANIGKHALHVNGACGKPVCDDARRLWNIEICKIQYK